MNRLQVDGKFFRAAGERVFLKIVTYGPFPEEGERDHAGEMRRIADVGFNAVRVYDLLDLEVLDAARGAGLWVFVGVVWEAGRDFVAKPSLYSAAEVALRDGLMKWGGHEAVAGVFVGNEIPADMVRWMGVVKVREALEGLIALGRQERPELLFAYANFPTTEYLEPNNADFTAMNVYLERREDFAHYLPRLHNVAGDRPVLLSEFGMDTQRNGEETQREVLLWGVQEALLAGMAGVTLYAWSDVWFNAGRVVDDWDFGLTNRSGQGKLALVSLAEILPGVRSPEHALELEDWPMFSVVVCTHNGGRRMKACLSALQRLDYLNYEVIVVDDGSMDDTVEVVEGFDGVRVISLKHAGLSAARNRGAEEAVGEFIAYTDDDCEPDAGWLKWLAWAFDQGEWDACGGPNLPPAPLRDEDVDEAVVASAPGAPSHVLLDDTEAEHLPGCNLVVRKESLEGIGGFNVDYRVAGDDVDFCWRLGEAGMRMGFCGAAFVWHRRRTTLWRYFKQQYGYGKAEALLMRDHPGRFRRGGGARWKGRVYAGGAMSVDEGDVIYHGSMGTAAYQQLALSMQPQRPLPCDFSHSMAKFKLTLAESVQPHVRRWARWWHSLRWRGKLERVSQESDFVYLDNMCQYDDYDARWWGDGDGDRARVLDAVLAIGWEALENDSNWDMERDGLRLLIAIELHTSGFVVLTRMEMASQSGGRLPADFVRSLEALGLVQM